MFNSKQIDRKEVVTILIPNIALRSIDDYDGAPGDGTGTAISNGKGIGIGAVAERTELASALDAVSINTNITPEVRRLTGTDRWNTSSSTPSSTISSTRGIIAREVSHINGTETVANTWIQIPDITGSNNFTLNKILIRDTLNHQPIESSNPAEAVYGLLTMNGNNAANCGIIVNTI